jgi:hypothetical protein
MKECIICAGTLRDQAKFCSFCGEKQPINPKSQNCLICGESFAENAKFCHSCASPVGEVLQMQQQQRQTPQMQTQNRSSQRNTKQPLLSIPRKQENSNIGHNQALATDGVPNHKQLKQKKILSWWFIIVAILQLFTIPNAGIALFEVATVPYKGEFIDVVQLIALILTSLFSAIINTFVSGKSPKFLTNFVGRYAKSTPFKTVIVCNVLYLVFGAYLPYWFEFSSVSTTFGVLAVVVSFLNFYWMKFSIHKTK